MRISKKGPFSLAFWGSDSAKCRHEVEGQGLDDFCTVDLPVAFFAQAGYTAIRDSTWHDEVEEIEVSVEVESKAVHGYPPAALHTNGTNLSRI